MNAPIASSRGPRSSSGVRRFFLDAIRSSTAVRSRGSSTIASTRRSKSVGTIPGFRSIHRTASSGRRTYRYFLKGVPRRPAGTRGGCLSPCAQVMERAGARRKAARGDPAQAGGGDRALAVDDRRAEPSPRRGCRTRRRTAPAHALFPLDGVQAAVHRVARRRVRRLRPPRRRYGHFTLVSYSLNGLSRSEYPAGSCSGGIRFQSWAGGAGRTDRATLQ